MGDQQHRAVERAQRRLERLAALEVEVVGGLVEHEHVGARLHEHGQREPPALAARERSDRLLGVLAREQEAAEQRARRALRQAGGLLGRLEHGGAGQRVELVGVLGQVAEHDVVPAP